jgi:CheY-like chemotaxis protein
MVISCPDCSKKFQFNGEVKSRARFRCTACGVVFSTSEESSPAESAKQKTFNVLAATENSFIAEAVKTTLGDERVVVTMASDGNQVMEMISKDKPHLLLLDAAIQGLFSFSICEIIKTDPSLKDIKIILTSAAFNKSRYKRKPSELFGAENYIEAHMLEEELSRKAGELLGIEIVAAPVSMKNESPAEHACQSEIKKFNGIISQDDDNKAKRLARIIAADILLYNRTKLSRKVGKQDALALFSQEIEEAVKYFTKRLPGADTAYIHAAIEECLDSINKAPVAVC